MAFNLDIFRQSKYTFEGKRGEEEVEIFLYSHWLIPLLKSIFYILVGIIPLIPLAFFAREIYDLNFIGITLIGLVAFYMTIWSMFFYEMMIYLLDTWIVTNDRILDIECRGFFIRTVSELDLARVQDISVKTTGFIQTIFDFGDIEIQSAGAVNKFRFRQVAHPQMVKDRIMKLVIEAKKANPSAL